MRTAKRGTDAVAQLGRRQEPCRSHHPPLAVRPLGLDRIEPRALARQLAAHDAHALPGLLDGAVVLTDPGPHLLADMPGGVVPDQEQGPLADGSQLATAPLQELAGHVADRAPVHKPQPARLVPGAARLSPAGQEPIAGQCLRIRVIGRDRLFDQVQGLIGLGPTLEGRARQATPPHLVLEPQGPVRVGGCQADQAVARAFFRAYSGSGLVIHSLARFQRTPSRPRVARIVSPLTRVGVSPSAKLTSAASSRVQRLVGLPNVRGLWCKRARSRSASVGSKARWMVLAWCEPGVRAASPCWLKAWS